VATGREIAQLTNLIGEGLLGDVAYSPDGNLLATPDTVPQQVVLRDAATLAPVAVLKGHTKEISSIAFRSDGKRVLTASWDRTLRLWDTATGAPLGVSVSQTSQFRQSVEIRTAIFSPNGTRIASAGFDRILRLWDAETLEEVAQFRGHTDVIHCLAFSPDGKTLASGSSDGTVRLWDTVSLAERLKERLRLRCLANRT
jgi:WD40 repeat protein